MAATHNHHLSNSEELVEDVGISVVQNDSPLSSIVLQDTVLSSLQSSTPVPSTSTSVVLTHYQPAQNNAKPNHHISHHSEFTTPADLAGSHYGQQSRSTDLGQHYSASSAAEGAVTQEDLCSYNPQSFSDSLRLSQYSDPSGQNEGLVQYSDGREGMTLTTLPLLSENGLNLVELGDGLTLDASSVESSGIMFRSDFNNSGATDSGSHAVVASGTGGTETSLSNLTLVERRAGEGGTGSITYLNTPNDDSGDASGSASTQYHLAINGYTDAQGNPFTIPLSLLNTSFGQSLLQQLGLVNQQSATTPATLFIPQLPSDMMTADGSDAATSQSINISHSESMHASFEEKNATNAVPSNIFRNKSGRPSLNNNNKNRARVLGSGPLAISAQGIVQQVDGRKVTVLPRPEDLQRLKDYKALVVDLPDKKALSIQRRRGPVPIRPHQRYGRARGRRGRPPKVVQPEIGDAFGENYVIPMVRERGVGRKRGRRGRRGSRGRGRGSSIMVVNSTGRRPGRPRKATTLLEGPRGARLIHTGPDLSDDTTISQSTPEDGPQLPYVASLASELMEVHDDGAAAAQKEEPDNGKRKLPPRVRGQKYSKMIEALMRPDDEIPSESSDEDDPDFRSAGQSKPVQTLHRTGKRGRPRKHPIASVPAPTPLVKFLINSHHEPSVITSSDSVRHKITVTTGPLRPYSARYRAPITSDRSHISINKNTRAGHALNSFAATLNNEDNDEDDIFSAVGRTKAQQIILSADTHGELTATALHTQGIGGVMNELNLSEDSRHITISKAEDHNIVSLMNTFGGKSRIGAAEEEEEEESMMLTVNNDVERVHSPGIDEPVTIKGEQITLVPSGGASEMDHYNLVINDTSRQIDLLEDGMLPPDVVKREDPSIMGIYLDSLTQMPGPYVQESSVIEIKEEIIERPEHQCESCGESFYFKRDYIRHQRLKHNLRPLECSDCGKSFTSLLALQDHEAMHSLEHPFNCNFCSHSFDRQSTLKAHILAYHADDAFICDKCGKQFSSGVQLKKHMQGHEEGMSAYSCEICGKLFGTKEAFSSHLKSHNRDRPHVCDICNLSFLTAGGLNRHRKVHKRMEIFEEEGGVITPDLFCKYCLANFSYEESLKKHLKIVHEVGSSGQEEEETETQALVLPLTEERVVEELQEQLNEGYAPKTSELYDVPGVSETLESNAPVDPFRCGICEETFTDVDLMCDHFTNSHTGEQRLYCDLCCVGCADDDQMARHKMVHTMEEQQSLIKKHPDDLPNTCLVCGKSYKTAQELIKHSKVHNIEKPYKCSICSACFPIKSALDKHLLVHTGERPFKCDVCLKSFRQSAALVRHKLWTHRLKNQNKCEICGKTFFTAALLLYHLDVHGEQGHRLKKRVKEMTSDVKEEVQKNVFNDMGNDDAEERDKHSSNRCEYCSKSFPSFVALLTHKLSHKLSASYKCDQCHRTFREKRYLQKHKMTHKGMRSWKCDICKKGFAAKLTLIRHSQVHLREALKPTLDISVGDEDVEGGYSSYSTLPAILKCNECNVTFMHKSHYVRHKLLHSGTPLLKCGLCDKMFVHKSDIIRHKVMHSYMFTCDICGRNFHKRSLYVLHKRKHMDEKPFKCPECFKCFSSSSNYNAHRRIHNGDKPFKCDRCHYRCSQSGRLVKHKRMHQGIKPFECSTCGKFFANADSVKAHQRLHTGDRPFRCDVCGKTFVNSGSLSQHKKDHDKEELYKCTYCPHKFKREIHLNKHKMYHEQQQMNSSGVQTLHMCEICGRVFDKKKYLYTHGNVHSKHKNFTCRICHKQLASRLALKNHEHIHTGKMPYQCQFCRKEFRSSSNLKRHLRVHDGQEALQCEVCKEIFYSREALDDHSHMHVMMVSDDQTHQSNNALPHASHAQLYVFESMGDGMDPQQLLVSSPQQQLFVDSAQQLLVFPENTDSQFNDLHHQVNRETMDSEAAIVTSDELNHDSQVGGTMVTTDALEVADNTATTENSLSLSSAVTQHQATSVVDEEDEEEDVMLMRHESVPQEVGAPCIESEVQEDVSLDDVQLQLNAAVMQQGHLQSGNNETQGIAKAHECNVCHKTFAKRQYLTKHMYRHREVKPHICDICGKGFAQKFEVVVHKIKHTGEKPYSCKICNKQFRSKVNLNNHEMRHNGEFPFLCSVCRKGFSTQLQLERHVTLHAGGMMPFTCQICNKGYNIRLNLLKHMAKAHNQQGLLTDDGSNTVMEARTVELSSISQDDIVEQPHIEVISSEDVNNSQIQEDMNYKNSGIAQITIRSQQDLMEDFSSGAQTVTLISKASSTISQNDDQLDTLPGDVALALGSQTFKSEPSLVGRTQTSQHLQYTQHNRHQPEIYHIGAESEDGNSQASNETIVYPSAFSSSHVMTPIASLERQHTVGSKVRNASGSGQRIAISLLHPKERNNILTNNASSGTDEQQQHYNGSSSRFAEHGNKDSNVNMIDVSSSSSPLLKDYYLQPVDEIVGGRDVLRDYFKGGVRSRVGTSRELEGTSVDLEESQRINVEHVGAADNSEDDPVINVVVVNEEEGIHVDPLS